MDLDQVNESWMDLIFWAVDYGIENVRDSGGPLIPFVVLQNGEEKEIHRFCGETLEESVEGARFFIREQIDQADYLALAYDGYVTIEGKKYDAIMVVSYSRSEADGILFAQRYEPKKFLKKFKTIGNVAFWGKQERP